MTEDTHNKLKEIKQSFRFYMNGVVSSSMRQKGANYKINWGVSLAHLNEIAQQYGKDEALADELWKENIRECKILATIIMPTSAMTKAKAHEWVSQIPTQEIAELASFHLFQRLPDAVSLAMEWLGSENSLSKICAYHILSNQFKQGSDMGKDDVSLFLSSASHSLRSYLPGEQHAALNALNHYADMDERYAEEVDNLLTECQDELQ